MEKSGQILKILETSRFGNLIWKMRKISPGTNNNVGEMHGGTMTCIQFASYEFNTFMYKLKVGS